MWHVVILNGTHVEIHRRKASDGMTCYRARSPGPPLGIAGTVNNGEDVHQIISNDVENTVGKSRQQGSSNTGQDFRIQQRCLLQSFQLELKRRLILRAQPLTLSLIPLISLTDLPDGSARKLQAIRHDLFFNFSLT